MIVGVMISACIAGSGEGKQDEAASDEVGQAHQALTGGTGGGCTPEGYWYCSDPKSGGLHDYVFVSAGPGCQPNEAEAEENCISGCEVSCVLN
jgi:hypothetical protein